MDWTSKRRIQSKLRPKTLVNRRCLRMFFISFCLQIVVFCRQKVPEGKAATLNAFVIKGSKVEALVVLSARGSGNLEMFFEMEEFYGI